MEKLEMLTKEFCAKHEEFITRCDAIEDTELWDKAEYGDMDAFYSNDLASVIIRLTAVDGNITYREVEYFNKTFMLDYRFEELKEVYNNCKDTIDHSFDESFKNGITLMRAIDPSLADLYKELLVLVCEIIIESDGYVKESEIEEAKRLKALCE